MTGDNVPSMEIIKPAARQIIVSLDYTPMVEVIWNEIQNFETIDWLCCLFRLQMRSLEAPYQTNCTQRTLQMLSTGDVYNYTKLACLKKCENQVIVKKCGCRPPMFYGNVFPTL